MLVFALNAILFVLLGLQFPECSTASAEQFSTGEIIGYGLLVSAVVIAVRIVWQFLPGALGRILPALGDLAAGGDWRERLLIGWSGMRGAVSLAAALALPFELDSGAPFASRDLIIYLTVAVILVTLVRQGLTLPALVRRLGLSAAGPWAPDEAVARLAAAQAALDRLDQLEADGDAGARERPRAAARALPGAVRALRRRALGRGRPECRSRTRSPATAGCASDLIEHRAARRLLEMRNDGRSSWTLFRRIQRDLDLDEARLGT